jgi:hypothetical protein
MEGFGLQGLLSGLIGGALYESSRWFGLKRRRVLPLYLWRLHYWLLTLLQVLSGGIAAGFLAPGGGLSGFLVGLAGPALLSRLGVVFLQSLHLAPSFEARPDASLADWLRG